ncbi:type IIL restriction-modification enzyme MmeI [Bosea sp. NPDC003192]|uniref:type IIL restriction-modification enzyme MmeI n=1 Tax=Bosea sp. NPDC003192 TaxID=3390551 RepID=UPI003D00AA84
MSGGKVAPDAVEVEAFIARWRASEGAERASFPSFIGELCELLRIERPQPPTSDPEAVTYRFEYPVRQFGPDGSATTGWIDLYRKRCFVAEAKQLRLKGQPKEILPAGSGDDEPTRAPRGRRGADRGLDVMMLNAKRQAEQYCRALPASHGWPPFIILCDVGHCFEFYADFSGQGKNYAQFPDRHRFRVYLEDLRDPATRERIARIWSDPLALDPARQAALATRRITGCRTPQCRTRSSRLCLKREHR